MSKSFSHRALAAAALAAGLSAGVAFAAAPAAQPLASKAKTADKTVETPEHAQAHEAHRVCCAAADRAIGPNGVTKVLELVARSDRDRIDKNLVKGDEAQYQKVADDFRSKWKAKYGEPFSAEGHVADMIHLKPTITGTGSDQRAVIQLPAETGQKGYELHLIREKSGWGMINLPDTVDGKTFSKNMMDSIQRLNGQVDKLPADKAQAYEVAVTEALHEMAFPSTAASASSK